METKKLVPLLSHLLLFILFFFDPSYATAIKKAGIAGYMTWNGGWMDPQAFSFAGAHFDYMALGSYQWENYPVSAIKGFKEAGMAPLGYQRLAQVEYSPTPEYCSSDWVEVNTHEDWFIHDSVTGGRIWNPSDDGFLMDIGNADFRQHWITYVMNNLSTYKGFTGIFIDNTMGSMNASWVPWERFDDGTQPVFKNSDLNNWHSNVINFLEQIKEAFPDKTIIINTDGFNYDYVDKVDGVMIEGFAHATWQSADTHSTSSGVLMQIDYFSTITRDGKLAWYCSGTLDGTPSQVSDTVKFTLSAALLSNNNPNSMFSFNDWFSFDDSHGYYPIMDTDIGLPSGAYYQTQDVHSRDFTNGKVLLNPSSNTYVVSNLVGDFTYLSGQSAASITLAPYSGEILIKKPASNTQSPGANLSNIVVYPNPFKPNRAQGQDKITFGGLAKGKLSFKIFSLSGRLVNDWEEESATGQVTWAPAAKDGKQLASGVYLYSITENNGNKANGKIAIIK
jgi:hypothetical protein